MFIKNLFEKGKQVVSFEVFPPKRDDDLDKLYDTINELKSLNPDYVSVTYGAGGSNRGKAVEIVSTVKNKIGIEVMAHLTCVNSTVEDIKIVLDQLKNAKIKNILALRGDPPMGSVNFTKTIGGFGYASELVKYISDNGDWSIGVAGYPEGHIENRDLSRDVDFLKKKIDNGGDFIITQLFFDNADFYKFRDLCVKKGINVPIVPGIFPILNYKGIKKSTELSGAKFPAKLNEILEKNQDNPDEVEKIGVEYSSNQAIDLINNGVDGIHLYTMNKSRQIKSIYDNIKNVLKRI